MAGKRSKWATHLKAAEASGLSLAAYSKKHRIDVHRLYEARQLRKLQGTTAWSVVHVKPTQIVEAASCVAHRAAPATLAMQARLGNGVILSWAQPTRQLSKRYHVVAVIFKARRHENLRGPVRFSFTEKQDQVFGYFRMERRAQFLPIRQQFGHGKRVHNRARQDVRTELTTFVKSNIALRRTPCVLFRHLNGHVL